jgi:hypothetical protein
MGEDTPLKQGSNKKKRKTRDLENRRIQAKREENF